MCVLSLSHPTHPPQLDGKHSMMKNVVELTRLGGKRLCGDFVQSWRISAGKPIKPAEEGNEKNLKIEKMKRKKAKNFNTLFNHTVDLLCVSVHIFIHIYMYI